MIKIYFEYRGYSEYFRTMREEEYVMRFRAIERLASIHNFDRVTEVEE